MNKKIVLIAGVGIIVVLTISIFVLAKKRPPIIPVTAAPAGVNRNSESAVPPVVDKKIITAPIAQALSRVTKKPYGIYITPKHSPVSPERFTGYHTGTDFETTPAEQNVDVPIYAICPGKLLVKEWASGYGGVINEACTINSQAVTVTYGHLKLTSIAKKVGQSLAQGEQIGVLGKGYSTETDGERKHLHLGIHKGAAAVLNGYVATKAELEQWINVLDFLK